MNAMTHPQKRHRRISCTEPEIDPSRMLEVLLALDRMVVEVSMHLYNVERHISQTLAPQFCPASFH